MLDESFDARTFEPGETVEGTILALRPDVAFLDVGGKSEATIDIEELRDAEGDLEVAAGDRIQAIVVSTAGGLKLSRRLARGAAARRQLEQAHAAGVPVEGRVERVIKGGYEVRVAGQRAFCPFSQIDVVRTAEPTEHEGRSYTFRITEYRDDGKNLVVSRRALLEEEQREQAERVRAAVVPGAVLPGRVVSLRDYGAFVDLGGGIQGLLHVSEMGWARVDDPGQVVKPGEQIQVQVLRVDQQKGRIALGLKQLQPDPWSRVGQTYEVGQVHAGKVIRLAEFGAFIELEPGVEGLAHVSSFAPTGTPDGWKATVATGQTVAVEVLSVDVPQRRIGVAVLDPSTVRASAAGPAVTGTEPIRAGTQLTGKVERHERFGVFVYLAPGRSGLLPLAETGADREGDLRKLFPIGSEVEVVVLESDPEGRRIRLSHRAVLESRERAEAQDWAERQEQTAGSGLGSMADQLRRALKRDD